MGQAQALGNTGLIYMVQGKQEEAIDYFNRALNIDMQTGYRQGEAVTLGNLALVYKNLEQPEKARDYSKRAQTLFKELNLPQPAGLADTPTLR